MNWKKAFSFVALAIFLFMADVALKAYVHYDIPTIHASLPVFPFGGIAIFRDWHGIDFSLVHVINKGAAWGIFASVQEYLLYARVAIIGGLLTYLFFIRASAYRKFCLMLMTTGALGNVDRLFCLRACCRHVLFYFLGIFLSCVQYCRQLDFRRHDAPCRPRRFLPKCRTLPSKSRSRA